MRYALSFLALALFLVPTASKAAAGKVFADVEVKLDDAKLNGKAHGIRTLYLTIYDASSPAPRPYGALKVDLTADAKGTFYKGKLNADNVMVMGGGEAPKSLRIKARLDKDGSAGPDSAGDLVGIAEKVAAGSKTTITIDKAI